MSSPVIPLPLTDEQFDELNDLRTRMMLRIEEIGGPTAMQQHVDLTAVYRNEDLDTMRVLVQHCGGRFTTRVALHVVDILHAEGINEVSRIVTTEMLEALLQISTAMAISEGNTAPNTFKVCSMVIPHLEREKIVIDLIRKRKIIDADDIAAILNDMENGSMTLAEGVL